MSLQQIFVDLKPSLNYDFVIYIPSIQAESAGYKGTVSYCINKACARDKALYYLKDTTDLWEAVWLIEEDVFIPALTTIANIDKKYKNYDLLCNANYIFEKPVRNEWFWNTIVNQTPLRPPFAASMVCAIRISPRLLQIIHSYVQQFRSLFLDEVLFNTLALKNNLSVLCPPELSTIVYRRNWQKQEIQPTHLYHPMKTLRQHILFRRIL